MNRKEAMRQAHQQNVLMNLGFTREESDKLRRISMTLRAWYERECGTDNGCIERDETTNKTYWLNSNTMRRYPIRDMETGAIKRLDKIISDRNDRAIGRVLTCESETEITVKRYLQTDPRGASLYIIRPGDIPAGSTVESCYSRGIVVY